MSVQTLRDLTPANSPKKNKIVSLKYLTLSNNNDASDRGDKTPQTARLKKRDSSSINSVESGSSSVMNGANYSHTAQSKLNK